MPQFLNGLVAQFREFYKSLTPAKRISLTIASVIVLATIVVISLMMSGRTYVALFKDVAPEHLSLIMEKLKEKNIPFKLDTNGNTLLVPPENVYPAQMLLMTELGTKDIGTIGLELFDKHDLGTTSYVQRINYQRALQGELMRAINSIESIKRSKVILALPPKKTFLEESSKPSASVVVDLRAGKSLSYDQVRGIANIVSAAVENLEPEDVVVLDSRGKLLSKNSKNTATALSNDMLEIKEKREASLEQRIEEIIGKVVGQGKVIAKVDAQLDLRNVTSVEEVFDPDKTAVRSIQTEEEKLNGNRSNPTGVPGSRANLPGATENGTVAFNQDVNKEYKTTNNEVSKTVKNVKEAPGKIEKLSVSVLVDGENEITKAADGTITKHWKARSPEEIQKYISLAKNTIGFDEKRGDVISIENIKFQEEDFTDAEQILNTLEKRQLLSYLLRWLIIGASFLLFFFAVVRPFIRWITDNFQESAEEMLPKTIEELEELQAVDNTLPGLSSALPSLEESIDPDKAESELLKDRIMGLIEADNVKAANALNLWLVRRD